RRSLTGPVVRVCAFENCLLRVAAIRIAALERIEQLDRSRIIAGGHHFMRLLIQALGGPSRGVVLDFGQQVARSRRERERDRDEISNPRQRHPRHPCDSGGSTKLYRGRSTA